ncbi:beta-ketoacyl-ACP synthase II [Aquihabitans sp. McL0605]|uniref:beta-ketoacyl-ACP synthase II n=1 Tax=Aquihabitans sp. McL0605 TaxID=3415671 RepID=UPI003CF2C092
MPEAGVRVAVTGMGAITPAGADVATNLETVRAARSAAGPITAWDASAHAVRIAAEVQDFDPTPWVEPRHARRIDRVSLLAIGATEEAIAQAGLEPGEIDPARIGVVIGSGVGGLISIEEQIETRVTRGPSRVSPLLIPMMMANASAGHVALRHGFAGPCMAISTACASGANSIGEGVELIRSGRADVVIVGGTEASITPTSMAAFARMGALSGRNDDPAAASRPFDRERDGFVMGEGAGILVLESEAVATRRGATILGWVVGHASTCDAHHITAPSPDGTAAVSCMSLALADAGLAPGGVAHINAHGTSTPLNDSAEAIAIAKVFGASGPPVTSTKGVTGHLVGAAGAVEAVFGLVSAVAGLVPPVANLTDPDVDPDIDLVRGEVRTIQTGPVLSNSFGFGGHNTSLVLAPA